ncbi:MAG: hypothetical protein QOD55_1294 [Solirubrobacteraceae bacterium]|nr:hypothetical protein [Solirubrobacteraceae bacterium]
MRRLDVTLAAALAVYAAVQVWVLGDVGGPALVSGPCLMGAALALAWRRVAPLGCVTAVAIGVTLQAATGEAPEGLVVSGPLLISAYSVAAYGRARQAVAGLAVALAATAAHTIGDPLIRTRQDVEDASFWWLVLVAGWIFGLAVHRHRQARALRATARELERQRDEAAARERTRMARELHDVVSHGVSVIALQAGAAQETLAGDPAGTRARLAAIEQTARDSAAELRRMLGILRDDGDGETAARAPLPDLRDLPLLVEGVRAAGLPVSLRVEGSGDHVPAGVQLSAYRVVQEGLTNAVKHGRPSRVDVLVRHRADGLEVSVVDDGAGDGAPPAGDGYGLAGLRERVSAHGGTLESRRGDGGGFVLRAHLPAEPS